MILVNGMIGGGWMTVRAWIDQATRQGNGLRLDAVLATLERRHFSEGSVDYWDIDEHGNLEPVWEVAGR